MSDIFGVMADAWKRGSGTHTIDANTWKFGEDFWTPGTSGDALRYLDSPTQDLDAAHQVEYANLSWYSRDWYPSRYTGSGDAGGVHFNSGLINLAFKLSVTGGQHPRHLTVGQPLNVPALSAADAEKIFYLANACYLGMYSGYSDLRSQLVAAANQLASTSAVPGASATVMELALDAVGIPYVTNNSRAMNMSVLLNLGTGSNVNFSKFIMAGGGTAQNMLVRAAGPALSAFGVTGYVSIRRFRSQTAVHPSRRMMIGTSQEMLQPLRQRQIPSVLFPTQTQVMIPLSSRAFQQGLTTLYTTASAVQQDAPCSKSTARTITMPIT